MVPRFASLKDWLTFCRQDEAPMAAADWTDPEHIDEIQQAVRMLTCALERYEDGQALVNQWLTIYGGGKWRLVSIVGKRTRLNEHQ
jgi:hypothetical protein